MSRTWTDDDDLEIYAHDYDRPTPQELREWADEDAADEVRTTLHELGYDDE